MFVGRSFLASKRLWGVLENAEEVPPEGPARKAHLALPWVPPTAPPLQRRVGKPAGLLGSGYVSSHSADQETEAGIPSWRDAASFPGPAGGRAVRLPWTGPEPRPPSLRSPAPLQGWPAGRGGAGEPGNRVRIAARALAEATTAGRNPLPAPAPGEEAAAAPLAPLAPLPPHRAGRQVPRNVASPARACSLRSPRLGCHVSPSCSKVRVSRSRQPRGEAGAGGGGGGRPLLPPAWRGRVCEGPGGRSVTGPPLPGRPRAGAGRGEAPRGKPRGRASLAARGPVLLGRKARRGHGPAPAPRAQRPLPVPPQRCAETPPHRQPGPTHCGGPGQLRSQKFLTIIVLSLPPLSLSHKRIHK